MTALRCTAKLLKAMRVKPVVNPAPAQNRLGEWTANLIRVGRLQLIVAVSEPTRFGVVVDAAPYAQLGFRLKERIFKALLFIGVPADLAAEEAEAMEPVEIAASNSRSVLSTINQFAWYSEGYVRDGDVASASQLTERLAEMIVISPKHIGMPVDRVREAFGLPPINRRRD
ncbi:MAG: hypothetical protein ABIQ70_01370 [Dokdonella sp.]